MRILMAVMVLSLGMVSAWAGGKSPQQGQKQTQVGAKQNSGPQLKSDSDSRKDSSSSLAQEKYDFYGSWIDLQARFVWINPGTFQMGSTKQTDPERRGDEEQHTVTLTRGFWLLDHEVTQREYEWVMGNNPSKFRGNVALPVEMVSWHDAVAFCERLTRLDRAQGSIRADQAYRLPTEAEWEYAARAETAGSRYTVDGLSPADSLDKIAWYNDKLVKQTQVVKGKRPNHWGLYDMMGNVWEWCSDWYEKNYPTGAVTDPGGPVAGSARIFRGGSWSDDASYARSACRTGLHPGIRFSKLGFRPALSSVP